MSWELAAWLLLGGSTVLIFLGLPVAFGFLVINLVGAWLYLGGEPGLVQLARSSVVSVSSAALTPIPLFVLMGEELFHTGLAVKVIDGIERLIKEVPGRLAGVAVGAGTGFSGISISKLLLGGVLPGLLLSLAFVAYIIVRSRLQPSLAPMGESTPYRGWDKYRLFVFYVLPLTSIFVIVIASMTSGWATPTESAAIGALATMLFAVVYRALTVKNLIGALLGTVSISGMILFIIVGATTFSQILSFSGASNGLVQWITGQALEPWVVVAAMMALLIFLGVFVDQVSMMMITLPIFMPVVTSLNIDLVWFGVMFLICMQLGMLLPPHGMLLMTMKGVAPPEVTMGHIFKAVTPYVIMSIVLLVLVFCVPTVAVWLPNLMD